MKRIWRSGYAGEEFYELPDAVAAQLVMRGYVRALDYLHGLVPGSGFKDSESELIVRAPDGYYWDWRIEETKFLPGREALVGKLMAEYEKSGVKEG